MLSRGASERKCLGSLAYTARVDRFPIIQLVLAFIHLDVKRRSVPLQWWPTHPEESRDLAL
jgi:hypothetical protein